MSLAVSDLYRYPVKSCRGEQLPAAPVEPPAHRPWWRSARRRLVAGAVHVAEELAVKLREAAGIGGIQNDLE